MSNKSSSYQIQHTHFRNSNVVPATSPASKLNPLAAYHPSVPRARTCPDLQPTMDCRCQSSERSGPWTRRGRPTNYLPKFCRSLCESIQVDANFRTRRANASRSECPCYVVPSGMPFGVSPATSDGPKPRYVFKSSSTTSGDTEPYMLIQKSIEHPPANTSSF